MTKIKDFLLGHTNYFRIKSIVQKQIALCWHPFLKPTDVILPDLYEHPDPPNHLPNHIRKYKIQLNALPKKFQSLVADYHHVCE